MSRLYILLLVFISLYAHAQVDSAKLDSLKRVMTADAEKIRHWQDSISTRQDSLMQARIKTKGNHEQAQNNHGIGAWIYVPVITGIGGLVVLAFMYKRRKRL